MKRIVLVVASGIRMTVLFDFRAVCLFVDFQILSQQVLTCEANLDLQIVLPNPYLSRYFGLGQKCSFPLVQDYCFEKTSSTFQAIAFVLHDLHGSGSKKAEGSFHNFLKQLGCLKF